MCDSYEILRDISKRGKERPWIEHKSNSMLLSESFSRLDKRNKAENICNCGSFLKFNICPQGHEKRLSWANFCRVRLCPMCSWRRSLLIAHQVKSIAHEASQQEKLRWLFLTLTVKNCEGEKLMDTINHLMKSFHRLSKRKVFNDSSIRGWFRAFEVTRNFHDGSYHPHFHVLLAVKPSYFNGKSKSYMTTTEWGKLWKACLKIDYDPVVHIRVVKNKRDQEKEFKILQSKGIQLSNNGTFELSGEAVAEMAKYSVKSSDYLIYNEYEKKGSKYIPVIESGIDEETTDEVVQILDEALARRRLIAFGGLMKEVWERLRIEGKMTDAESEEVDLVHVSEDTRCQCSVCGSNMLEELYSWLPEYKNYIKKENILNT